MKQTLAVQMFKGFMNKTPSISIFHSSSSQQSVRALEFLRKSAMKTEFNLEVVEDTPPNTDQLKTIQSYLPPGTRILSLAHPTAADNDASDTPLDAQEIEKMAKQNLKAVRWPVVVDWYNGRAAVGELESVKDLVKALNIPQGDGVDQPKGWFS